MTIRKPRMFLLVCWLISSGIGGLVLPSVAAQSTADSIQKSVGKKTEGGIFTQNCIRSGTNPRPAFEHDGNHDH